MGPIAIPLARPDAGQITVPGVASHLWEVDPGLVAALVEEAQLDSLRDALEDREVGAAVVSGRAQRVRLAGPCVTVGCGHRAGSEEVRDRSVLVNEPEA